MYVSSSLQSPPAYVTMVTPGEIVKPGAETVAVHAAVAAAPMNAITPIGNNSARIVIVLSGRFTSRSIRALALSERHPTATYVPSLSANVAVAT
jgi:uncharacterized protein (DUF427 family)